jgi:acetolactate synthase-1/2/3 large subunit
MAMEFKVMASSKERFRSTDISGNYSEFAKALGGYGERITNPGDITAALKRGIQATKEGKPALLEFITTQEKIYSTFHGGYHGGA